MGWTLCSEPKVPAQDRISGYICFETLPLLVNERERLLSHPFSSKVCEGEGNWSEKKVRYMSA